MDILQLWPRMVATHSVVFPPLSAAAQPGGGSLTNAANSFEILFSKQLFPAIAQSMTPIPSRKSNHLIAR